MKTKLSKILVGLMVAALLTMVVPLTAAQITLPDTTCAPQVGVGAADNPHAYYTGNGIVTFAQDACPTTYSGELGFGFGGVWLFSRTTGGVDPDGNAGGDGVEACYGVPSSGHHGADTTIHVQDDFTGGSVGFTVTRDWNRTTTNAGGAGTGNNAGDADCGDNLVEPCTAAQEAETDPLSPDYVPGGCNHLDASFSQLPADGLCTGITGLGIIDLSDPAALVAQIVAWLLGLVASPPTDLKCAPAPGSNSWTVPSTEAANLEGFSGADGAVVLFIFSNLRPDNNHAGTGTTGAVWTDSDPSSSRPTVHAVAGNNCDTGNVNVELGHEVGASAGSPVGCVGASVDLDPAAGGGNCVYSPGPDGYTYTCTYVGAGRPLFGCPTWAGTATYRSNSPVPHAPGAGDTVISLTSLYCGPP